MSLEVRESRIHGRGVFTTRAVPCHHVVCKVVIARVVTPENPLDAARGEVYYHCHWLPDGTQLLLAAPYCYLNHSFRPNIFYYTVNRAHYCLALRDIAAGEELRLDYSLCNIGGKVWECRCGEDNCRGRHRCGFAFLEPSLQLAMLPYLDPLITAAYPDAIQEILEKDLNRQEIAGTG